MTLGSRPSVSVAHELPPGVLPGSQEPRGKGVRWRGLVACGMSPPPPPRRPPGVSQARLRQGMERRCLGCSVWREMRRDEPRARPPGGVTIRGRSLTALSPGSRAGAADAFQLNRCGHALRPAEKDREAAPGARQAASRPPCIPLPQEASGRPLSQREGRNRAPGRGRRVGEEPVAISHPCSGPSTGKGPGLRRSGRVCVRACVHRRVRASS